MKKKIYLTYEELFFIGFFSLLVIGKSIGLGANNKSLQIMTMLGLISLSIKIIITKYTSKEAIISLFLIILGISTYLASKRAGVLLSILTIIGLKNIPYKKIFVITFKLRLILYITTISLSFIKVIDNNVFMHWRDGVGYIYRYGLGYEHPNLLHSSLFILVVLFIYLNYEKLNVLYYFTILLANTFIYKYSGSRTGFYLIILAIILTIYMKKTKNNSKYILIKSIMPLSIIFTFATAILYDENNFTSYIDRLLSGRIYYSNYFVKNYSFNLLGNNLHIDNNLIDNSYVILFCNYGILVFLLYIISYNKILTNFKINRMDKEMLMVVLFSIYGITEGFLPNIFMNISLVFLSSLIFKNISVLNLKMSKKSIK